MELSTKRGRIFIDHRETEHGGRYVKVTQSRKNKETDQFEAFTIFMSENETREFAALMQRLVETLPEADATEVQEGEEVQGFKKFNGEREVKKWTEEEEETLRRRFEEEKSVPALAQIVGRTEMAVWYRLKKLGLVEEIPEEFKLKDE